MDLEWLTTKRELAEIDRSLAFAASVRSKINWAIHGDKPTKLFLNLEKKEQLTRVFLN